MCCVRRGTLRTTRFVFSIGGRVAATRGNAFARPHLTLADAVTRQLAASHAKFVLIERLIRLRVFPWILTAMSKSRIPPVVGPRLSVLDPPPGPPEVPLGGVIAPGSLVEAGSAMTWIFSGTVRVD